jgi:hypothetical protein
MMFAMRASQAIPWAQMITRATVLANWGSRKLFIAIPRAGEGIDIDGGTRTTNHGYLR